MTAVENEERVTPITKVLQLMNGLLAKTKKSKDEEATKFAKFDTWCTGQRKTKTTEIKEDKQKIEKLSAQIEKDAVLIKQTDDKIKELEEDVGRWTQDKKSASTVRSREKSDFTATQKSYTESLQALDGAIATLKKQDFTRAQVKLVQESLLQVQSQRNHVAPPMPAELMTALTALTQESSSNSDQEQDSLADSAAESLEESTKELAQMNDEDEEGTAAKAPGKKAGYEFQSGGVVDMLGKLKVQFSNEKTNLEKEELAAQNAYDKLMQGFKNSLDGAQAEISSKKSLLAKTQKSKAENEGNLKATEKELEEDTEYLKETNALCQGKTRDFQSRKKLREDEISSLSKAISIIESDTVKGAGDRNLKFIQLLQAPRRATALAYLRSEPQSPLQDRMAVFLSDRAKTLGSALLLDVAQHVQADPFTKVKKLVKDLIIKLMEEATAEVEKKGWCDTELRTNKMTREKKTEEVEQLQLDIEDLSVETVKLGQDIASLQKAVKELDTAMMSATKDRQESKAANKKTIKEAKAAALAVEQAMGVLKDFYANAAEATAFVQAEVKDSEDAPPETFDESYQGEQAEGGGVIGILEVILSDFTRLDSDTSSAEAVEEQTYKDYMLESAKDRASKATEISLKEATLTEKKAELHEAKVDLKNTKDALDKANKYYNKLKPDCVDLGISYSERVKRREAEIQSLQEALKILSY